MAASAQIPITPFGPEKKHSDRERWICVYPAYINSKKTRQEGRRVSKSLAVDNPTYVEIKDVLSATNLRIGVENKLYPRERSKELNFRGRIRVQLRNDDGTPFNPDFPSRDSVLLYLCQTIPHLKTRQGKHGEQQQASAGGSGGGQQGKKGKGKRR